MIKTLRLTGKIALGIVAILIAYLLVGFLLSLVPVNSDVEPGNAVIVYLKNNGIHADIVVPTKTEFCDWTTIVPPSNTTAKVVGAYVAVGWGSRNFYLNAPEWKDLSLGIAIKAISGSGGTALHATYVNEPVPDADCRRLLLSADQYKALVQYILSSGKRNADGSFIHIAHPGYRKHDAFYVGEGRYSPVFTCNTWVNSALKSCGQKCCLWTAFHHPIFWKY